MTIFGLNIGKPRPVTPSDAGSALAHARIANDRAKVRARTRWLREQMGMPEDQRIA